MESERGETGQATLRDAGVQTARSPGITCPKWLPSIGIRNWGKGSKVQALGGRGPGRGRVRSARGSSGTEGDLGGLFVSLFIAFFKGFFYT